MELMIVLAIHLEDLILNDHRSNNREMGYFYLNVAVKNRDGSVNNNIPLRERDLVKEELLYILEGEF